MSDSICPECGYENNETVAHCAGCGNFLDRTITSRDQLSLSFASFDETAAIPESVFESIKKALAASEQNVRKPTDDEVLETPAETLRVSMDNDESSESNFGQLAIVGDLVLTHEATNTQFHIPQQQLDEVVIGRKQKQLNYTPTIDLSIVDGHKQGVSRRHATLMKKNGYMVIIDHQSKNGTYLNGMRIASEQPRIIRDNDSIRLGLVTLLVQYQTQ